VFDEIARAEPLLFLQLGDLHYRNLESTRPDAFVRAYDDVLTGPAWSALLRQVPMAYLWDDHDYGPNNADARSPTRTAARSAYRSVVPHYGVPPGDAAINQAFSIGRVRVVMTDTRSERTDRTMLGEAQIAWLIEEITRASRTHAVVVWANPTPWVGEATAGGDTWAGYDTERRRIADAVAAANVRNLVMVSGDAHMVAIDDGTNTDYSANRAGGFALLHAAPLDRPGSTKGGPYTIGPFTDGGQFGLLDVRDDGGPTVEVTLTGRRWDGAVLATHTVSFAAPAGAAP
jgi:phosphodiesterase/alkaline phosphatase D-like protein